jgi:CRISPR-associated protein Cas8a1/Csx13
VKLELDLGNPSFTLLHGAGLAGLYMTLKQLGKEIPAEKRPGRLDWQLSRRRVTLNWEGNDLEVLDWLLKSSFQIDDGIISLKGLDSETMDIQPRLIAHQGILGTFLQHNSTHKSTGTVSKSFVLEEDKPEIVVTYKSLTSYVYQEFASNLCDKNGRLLDKPISVAGWLNPGAVVRHIAFSADTSFEEPPEQALVLLFAPVACYYYILRSKLRDKRAQYALVVPEVTDLEVYAGYRQQPKLRSAGYKDFFASGLGDAGLRFLTYQTTVKTAETYNIQRCQVLTLGTVAWSTQQKTRTDLYVVEAKAEICDKYQVCCDNFSDGVVAGKDGGFVASSFARELIADNLAKSKPWYSGLSEKVNSKELFDRLTYEKKGLYAMVQKADSENEKLEKLFVEAFHEALYFIYGQIKQQVEDKGGSPEFQKELRNSLFKREAGKIRSELVRARRAEKLREFLVRFFTQAGRVPKLKEHWTELMQMAMGRGDWKLTRDLALLALASYKGKGVKKSGEEENKGEGEEEEEEEAIDIGL